MATSALPGFINAVKSALGSYGSLSGIRIFDGIEIDQSYPGDAIVIGSDGRNEGDEVIAGSTRQEYKQLGAISKFEDGALNCVVWAWDGTTDLSARRTRAYTLLGYVENVIRNDVSFGGVVLYSGLENTSMTYRQTTSGAVVLIDFTITYKAKI
jgi:hypothetical protein